MNYLYSLYDALVSISVPSDKARAVVDAMERDMGTTLATKSDLDNLRLATKQDLLLLKQEMASLGTELKQGMASLRTELRQEMASLRTELKQEIEGRYTLLDQKIDSLRGEMTRDLAALDLRLTVKLGSMLFVGFGLTIAAMRLWV
jgi:hypothetical protein